MSRYNKPVNFTTKEILLQVLILAAMVALLVWFQPRGQATSHFEVGRPWLYGQFIAPHEFIVYKSQGQLSKERDSIRSLFEPYMELNERVDDQQMARFRNDYRQFAVQEFGPNYKAYVEERLLMVYARGIASNKDLQLLRDSNVSVVRVYQGIESQSRHVEQLLSLKAAYEFILAGADSSGLTRSKLQKLDLSQYLEANLTYDERKSTAEWNELVGSITKSSGVVVAGQRIIDRGEIVTEQTAQILKSYEASLAGDSNESDKNLLILLGQILFVALICIAFSCYINLFRRDYMTNWRCVTLLLAIMLPFPMLTCFLVRHTLFSVYLIPYAMLPVLVRVFMDSRTAFFTHITTILICALPLRYPFEFVTTEFLAGLVAIYSLRELSTRYQIIRTSVFLTAAALLVYLSIDLIHGHIPFTDNMMQKIDWSIYKHIMVSGVLLLFVYPLMYFLEKIFGFISNVTLIELSNLNNPLLRKLSEVAPGTFQHSIQVANLAAEVALKIGAKSQLVRTGALYHDIGKMQNAAFFTENQAGSKNPHDMVDNRQSASIIIKHVSDGEQLADHNHLPKIIRDFISTHHGTGVVKYFYISYQNKHPEEKVDPVPFSYAGPNPSTAEQAILMMADAVEASARSLKEYNEETIGKLVDRIIDTQMAEGFFVNCPITFQDVATAKKVFKEKLKIVYHTRVSYPELNKKAKALEATVSSPSREASPKRV